MKQYLMGIDLGTSSCKVSVFERDGKVVVSGSGEYPVYYPQEGWAEQDPNEWWDAICKTIQLCLQKGHVDPSAIVGIGIDGQGWSAIPVDQDGNILANTPIWMDTRAQDICDELNEKIGMDRIFEVAGNALQPSYTTAKILWFQRNKPEIYSKIDKILQSNGYIAYKMTGEFSQDLSQGYGLHCFDMRTGTWDQKMCEELGIPFHFLPPLVACHSIVGSIHEQAAKETGLSVGTPVVAGGLDAACGTLGAGVIHAGETQEQGGQAGGMSICLDQYEADPRLILGYHVVPDKWLLQGGTTGGGGVMRWLNRELGAEHETCSLALFNELAEEVPAGSDGLVFLPYMAGERSPIWDSNAKGVYFGLDFQKSKGHLIRAAMEGVAYSLHHNLEVAKEVGVKVDVLRSMGGSANSHLWTQIKSDVTGLPIIVSSSDTATTLGAAILAGVGVGIYDSFEEAVALTVTQQREHTSNVEHSLIYNRNYDTYLKLYDNLKHLMQE